MKGLKLAWCFREHLKKVFYDGPTINYSSMLCSEKKVPYKYHDGSKITKPGASLNSTTKTNINTNNHALQRDIISSLRFPCMHGSI